MRKHTNILTLFVLLVPVTCARLPEVDLSTPELIKYWGYPVEEHETLTEDGYYLTLHRIPHGKGNKVAAPKNEGRQRPVIFLQHGLLDTSAAWVINLPHQSFGFILADAGFDVWMGNVRGNTYSKKHVKYQVSGSRFWNFCFDEMAKHDFPTMIDYVLKTTNQTQLYYVGHSQGTMMAFAGLSERTEIQEKIKVHFALAPISRLYHITNALKRLSFFETEFKWFFKLLGINEFLPSSKVLKDFSEKLCTSLPFVCKLGISLASGFDLKNLNGTRIPVYLSHLPAGTSSKNMLHYMQLVSSGMFQKYDYGMFWNLMKYRSKTPPAYNVEKVKTPTVLISGSHDLASTPKDVEWTAEHLPNVIRRMKIPGYNHIDFLWAMNADNKIYKKIITMTRSFT